MRWIRSRNAAAAGPVAGFVCSNLPDHILTTRQESLRESTLHGHTLDLQSFSKDTARVGIWGISQTCFSTDCRSLIRNDPEPGHVLTIPLLLHLLKQRAIESGIDPTNEQLDERCFRNRSSIYRLVMGGEGGLVAKGCRSHRVARRSSDRESAKRTARRWRVPFRKWHGR